MPARAGATGGGQTPDLEIAEVGGDRSHRVVVGEDRGGLVAPVEGQDGVERVGCSDRLSTASVGMAGSGRLTIIDVQNVGSGPPTRPFFVPILCDLGAKIPHYRYLISIDNDAFWVFSDVTNVNARIVFIR